MKTTSIFFNLCVIMLLAFSVRTYAGDKSFSIQDKYILQGWEVYKEAECGLCHGGYDQGYPAPNLVDILNDISREQFVKSVIDGKGLMPPFIDNKQVIENIDNIYSFIKARSDGLLNENEFIITSKWQNILSVDTLKSYARKCDVAVGVSVPDFLCDNGTLVPTTNHNPSSGKCDEPNRLNKKCDPGTKFTVLTNTQDAIVVALCRKKGRDAGRFGDIAVIQTNRKTGATCFYQALGNLDGNVKAPSKGINEWEWESPAGTATLICVSCHDNGAILRSPYLAQLNNGSNALPGATNSRFNSNQPYSFIGDDFATWKVYNVEVDSNRCISCHRLGVSNQSLRSRGTAIDFSFRATAREEKNKNPYSTKSPIWMPPGHVFFDETNADAARHIKNCAMRLSDTPLPNSANCRITEITKQIGDVFPGNPVVEGNWIGIRTGHQLILMKDGRVLDWVSETGGYRLWEYNPNINEIFPGNPIAEGKWGGIKRGHKLIRMNDGRVLDWIPDTGVFKLWNYDPNNATDIFPGSPIAEGKWTGIRTGHQLIPMKDGKVLDWTPRTGAFKLWTYNPNNTNDIFSGKPIAEGNWAGIRTGHELIRMKDGKILDWVPNTGDFRLWKYELSLL